MESIPKIEPGPNAGASRGDPWFIAFSDDALDVEEPAFFDRAMFPWIERIEAEWTVIRDELVALLDEHEDRLEPYFKEDQVSHPGRWKVFPFFYWRWRFWSNCRRCPRTVRLIESIPNVTTGAFSILDPETTIKPHIGDTNAIARCHLGLVVPASLPECGIRITEEEHAWEEGRFLTFCDAHLHTAWNHTTERRVILFVDVVRPEYADQVWRVCRIMLLSVGLSLLVKRFPALARYKRRMKSVLLPVASLRLPNWARQILSRQAGRS